ncbi:MAG: T9SS type A sorting domain-containing protein [bacterium]
MYKCIASMLLFVCALSGQGFLNIKVNTDNTTQIQNEQQIVINPTDTLNLVADWRDFRVGYRQVGHAASMDGGRTWIAETLFVEPTYIWDSDPGMTVDANGNFYAIILSFNSTSEPNGYFLFQSTDKGVTWSAPRTVVNGVANVFEDKELIACDRTSSPYTGNLYVAWARFLNYSTPAVYFTRSTNQGFNWSAPIQISDNQGNLQWPVPAVGANGEVYVAWCYYNAIRFDRSTNGGVSFGTDRTVQSIASMNRYVKGTILTFSYPAMDVDITNGPYRGYIYVAYMDNGTDGYPDMFFTRSTDGGNTWSTKVRINDDAVGNNRDQFHPWLTVDRTGCISVIFYDSRNDPNNILCDLYLAQSTDGGVTWLPNVRVTNVSFDLRIGFDYNISPYDPNKPLVDQRAGLIGEYNGLAAASKGNPIPIWTDTRNGNQDTYVGVMENIGLQEHYGKLMTNPVVLMANPVHNYIFLELNLKQEKNAALKFYNSQGNLVKQINTGTLTAGSHRLKIDISSLGNGVYFMTVGNVQRKIVIVK